MPSAREVLLHPTVVVREQLHWRRPLEVSIVGLVVMFACVATDNTKAILPLVIGILFAGVADSGEAIGIHWRSMIWFSVWVAIAGTLGGFASMMGYWELAVVAAVALCTGFASCLSTRATFGATITLVTYAVFAGVPTTIQDSVHNGMLILVGGLITTVVAVARTLVTRPSLLEFNQHPEGTVIERLRRHLNPDDDMFRHAVRLAVAMVIATTIADYLTWPHEYWIPMTVAWVAKPDRTGTVVKSWERVVGTLLGIAVIDLVLLVLPHNQYAQSIVAASGIAIALIFLRANYPLAVVGVTVVVLGVFILYGEPVFDTSLTRIKATILAGLIAVGASLIWPSKAKAA